MSRRNAPADRQPLPVNVQWDGTETPQAYLGRLADANGIRRGSITRRALLAELQRTHTVAEVHALMRTVPADYPAAFAHDPLLGWATTPEGTPVFLLDTVDLGAWGMRLTDMASTFRQASHPLREARLLRRIAQIVLPRMTSTWPVMPTVTASERAAALSDPTRFQPLDEWSLQLRRVAVQGLSPAFWAVQGSAASPSGTLADYFTAGRWLAAADGLGESDPELADALRRAAHDWPGAVLRDDHTETGPGIRLTMQPALRGPFSVPLVAHAPLAVLNTLFAATCAINAGELTMGVAPLWLTESPSRRPRKIDAVEDGSTVEADADRLRSTPAGLQVLLHVQRLSDAAPFTADEVRQWWPTLIPPAPVLNQLRLLGAGMPTTRLQDLLWISLTGHLPYVSFHGLVPTAVRRTCQLVPPDALMLLLEWASKHLRHDLDLVVTPRHAVGHLGERALG